MGAFSLIVVINLLNRYFMNLISPLFRRNISFTYVYWVFNRVDTKRIAEVGPDLACAEWLMRNSAYVRFKGRPKLITGYYQLPVERTLKLSEIHAVNSSITSIVCTPERLRRCREDFHGQLKMYQR